LDTQASVASNVSPFVPTVVFGANIEDAADVYAMDVHVFIFLGGWRKVMEFCVERQPN
jgi:hypothetical protein